MVRPQLASGSSGVGPAGAAPTEPRRGSGSSAGLYGSDVGQRIGRATVAEFVGTALLVFVGTSTAVAGALSKGAVWDTLAVVLAFGLVLVALAATFGHVSGCHVNPAVTLGLAVTGRFPWKATAAYVVAQLAGGVVGALATWVCYGDRGRLEGGLGATVPAAGVSTGRAFVVELLITFLLVLVVVSVATDERAEGAIAPIAVGFALAGGIFVAVPLTGGAVNPARAFGPDLVAGQTGSLWLYLVAPVVGGILAAVLYDRVLAPGKPPE